MFSVSNVAHVLLTLWPFGWNLDPVFARKHFRPFVLMLHPGTAVALPYFHRSRSGRRPKAARTTPSVSLTTIRMLRIETRPSCLSTLQFEA